VHTDTGQGFREDGSPIDYILVCIYEPYKTIEGISIDLSCPLDPGDVPTGFTYKKDGNVVISWGEQEPGPRAKIFADEGTYEADGETHKEEKCCNSTPVDDMVPAQMPEDGGAETSEPPSGECTQYGPYEVVCEAPEEEECVYSPPDDLFQPSDSPVCIDPEPDGEPCCNEWEGAKCQPLDTIPPFEDAFESGHTSAWCTKVSGADTGECSDTTDLSMCEAELQVLTVYEGVSCDSEDVAWILIDDGDGQYFNSGDVGFDQNGNAFYYTGPFEFENYQSDTLVGATCANGRLVVETTIYAYEIYQYVVDGKVTYVIGYDHAESGSTFMSDEMEFDLSERSSNQ